MEQKAKVQDKIEDLRDEYETSQNPLIWQIREGIDYVTAETDHALAVNEIRKLDPLFDEGVFLEEMEEYMIPRVVTAYLKGDLPVLESCCTGQVS